MLQQHFPKEAPEFNQNEEFVMPKLYNHQIVSHMRWGKLSVLLMLSLFILSNFNQETYACSPDDIGDRPEEPRSYDYRFSSSWPTAMMTDVAIDAEVVILYRASSYLDNRPDSSTFKLYKMTGEEGSSEQDQEFVGEWSSEMIPNLTRIYLELSFQHEVPFESFTSYAVFQGSTQILHFKTGSEMGSGTAILPDLSISYIVDQKSVQRYCEPDPLLGECGRTYTHVKHIGKLTVVYDVPTQPQYYRFALKESEGSVIYFDKPNQTIEISPLFRRPCLEFIIYDRAGLEVGESSEVCVEAERISERPELIQIDECLTAEPEPEEASPLSNNTDNMNEENEETTENTGCNQKNNKTFYPWFLGLLFSLLMLLRNIGTLLHK